MKNLLPQLNSRRDYFDYLDRWTVGTVDDLRESRTTRALVKAFLLETSHANGHRDTVTALESADQVIHDVDSSLLSLRWPGDTDAWAVVDIEDERYPVLYTGLESQDAQLRIDKLVRNSPLLDRSWFAANVFRHLWDVIGTNYPEHRFSQLVFEYEDVYEANPVVDVGIDDTEVLSDNRFERRRARMQISERIGRLRNALDSMRPVYTPLESIVRIRIPAPQHGGVDVYYNGQFTNRSDSIISLTQAVQWMMSLYRNSTELVETLTWAQSKEVVAGESALLPGAPLLIKFNETLDAGTFNRWIASLSRKNNRFRLWGTPIHLGDSKVHLYAVDNHLWQTIDLEITREHLYAVLPTGTCGNTIHRIVTNVQRFVDPKPSVYVGDQTYDALIERIH